MKRRYAAHNCAPLDEGSVRCRDLYFTTHNTHNTLTSMPRCGSNPQSQQAISRRPTPYTARPPGSTSNAHRVTLLWGLRFWTPRLWISLSPVLWCRVVWLKRTGVLEKFPAFFVRTDRTLRTFQTSAVVQYQSRCPDGAGNRLVWNVGKLRPDDMA